MTTEERLAAIELLHRSHRQTRNLARPRCAECGFPHPCRTAELARGEATNETENSL